MNDARDTPGRLHRHADGTEHRHFSRGSTIGKQVIADQDGREEHQHGFLGRGVSSGPPVWIEGLPLHSCRAEPHCLCGENAWFHRDTTDDSMAGAAECGMTGCTCQTYRRCLEYRSQSEVKR